MKRKDIFCHRQEDERSPQLLEAVWEGQPLVWGDWGCAVSMPFSLFCSAKNS